MTIYIVYVVAQFYPWFKFICLCFKLVIIHYHTKKKQRKTKFQPRTKLNNNIYKQKPVREERCKCLWMSLITTCPHSIYQVKHLENQSTHQTGFSNLTYLSKNTSVCSKSRHIVTNACCLQLAMQARLQLIDWGEQFPNMVLWEFWICTSCEQVLHDLSVMGFWYQLFTG